MSRRSLLVAVSVAQLCAHLAGLVTALRRRRSYDLGFLRGAPEHVVRDALWIGTAYSAPPPMIAAQVWATVRLRRGPDEGARRILSMLGVLMVPGYLMERFGRASLRPRGLDPVETPIEVAGVGLAAAMAVLGHQEVSGA